VVAAGALAALIEVEAMSRSRFRVVESKARFELPRSHTCQETRFSARTRPHLLPLRTLSCIVMAFVSRCLCILFFHIFNRNSSVTEAVQQGFSLSLLSERMPILRRQGFRSDRAEE
jgi:hypothetical protein